VLVVVMVMMAWKWCGDGGYDGQKEGMRVIGMIVGDE
jgi:hypothetical protein